MIGKLTLAAGFGAGYVLGAKAGTRRYEQIMAKARELAGMPAVQGATTTLQQSASTLADRARETVNDKVSSVSDKVPGSASASSQGTGPASPRAGAAASVTAPDVATTPYTG